MSKKNEEEVYVTKIKFKCPKRGIVEQEVKVKKYAAQSVPEAKATDETIAELLSTENSFDD
jgi:succinate dehydrogenase flavin-adding protein (antitoxin of CptAB toxin-antitoxin module)